MCVARLGTSAEGRKPQGFPDVTCNMKNEVGWIKGEELENRKKLQNFWAETKRPLFLFCHFSNIVSNIMFVLHCCTKLVVPLQLRALGSSAVKMKCLE